MSELKQIYRCNVCGNKIEVLDTGAGELVCCNQPMELLKENSIDAATEKHVPLIEKTEEGYKVTVGEVEHPMEEEHYIKWIELIADGVSHIKHLKPGDRPKAEFCIKDAKDIMARAYCNLHGLWKKGF